MARKQPALSILVVHGPNLNMLGKREPSIYGTDTLADIDQGLKQTGKQLGITVETFQSNHEGAIVDRIQAGFGTIQGLIINPGAYTHTSVAIRDALLLFDIPIIEIHLSNIYKREAFRHSSMIAGVATGQIAGFGAHGYTLAIQAMARLLSTANSH
ncbi:MAG: type II 3-dehydroquinate dehydratase [Desulfobacterales bacterium]|jgi:3-dehydroquinate dehydratase-2|nr:type II 3-dehydroquinate dehydratase [Desulfobacterales bacterium]